jgi:hypothetical protein
MYTYIYIIIYIYNYIIYIYIYIYIFHMIYLDPHGNPPADPGAPGVHGSTASRDLASQLTDFEGDPFP